MNFLIVDITNCFLAGRSWLGYTLFRWIMLCIVTLCHKLDLKLANLKSIVLNKSFQLRYKSSILNNSNCQTLRWFCSRTLQSYAPRSSTTSDKSFIAFSTFLEKEFHELCSRQLINEKHARVGHKVDTNVDSHKNCRW